MPLLNSELPGIGSGTFSGTWEMGCQVCQICQTGLRAFFLTN